MKLEKEFQRMLDKHQEKMEKMFEKYANKVINHIEEGLKNYRKRISRLEATL